MKKVVIIILSFVVLFSSFVFGEVDSSGVSNIPIISDYGVVSEPSLFGLFGFVPSTPYTEGWQLRTTSVPNLKSVEFFDGKDSYKYGVNCFVGESVRLKWCGGVDSDCSEGSNPVFKDVFIKESDDDLLDVIPFVGKDWFVNELPAYIYYECRSPSLNDGGVSSDDGVDIKLTSLEAEEVYVNNVCASVSLRNDGITGASFVELLVVPPVQTQAMLQSFYDEGTASRDVGDCKGYSNRYEVNIVEGESVKLDMCFEAPKPGNYILNAIIRPDCESSAEQKLSKNIKVVSDVQCGYKDKDLLSVTCSDSSEIVTMRCVNYKFVETGKSKDDCKTVEFINDGGVECSNDLFVTCSDGSQVQTIDCQNGKIVETGKSKDDCKKGDDTVKESEICYKPIGESCTNPDRAGVDDSGPNDECESGWCTDVRGRGGVCAKVGLMGDLVTKFPGAGPHPSCVGTSKLVSGSFDYFGMIQEGFGVDENTAKMIGIGGPVIIILLLFAGGRR